MRIMRFFLVDLVEFVLVSIMVALCVDIFIGVYTRYVMGEATYWHEEVARYLFIWMVFLGAAVAVRRRMHYVVHLIVDRFGGGGKYLTSTFCWLLVMGFSVFLFIQGLKVMEGVSVQVSPALELNLSWVFLAVPVNGVLSSIYAGEHLWREARSRTRGGAP
jgi:TRAP-type C4-dicarboxylate transport system permease small subunit